MSKCPSPSVNVGKLERWLSGIGGVWLLFRGLRQQRSLAGLALGAAGVALMTRAKSGHCLAYKAMGIDRNHHNHRVIRRTLVVNAKPVDVYAFWRNPENLAQLSDAITEVRVLDANHSLWKVKTPGGVPLEWQSEIIEDHPNEIIAWHSQPGTIFENAGTVRFELPPGGWGTMIHLQFAYRITSGTVQNLTGALTQKVISTQIDDALARMHKLLKTASVPAMAE